MREGWLVVKWSHFLHDVGFTSIDPEKPFNWSEFFVEMHERDAPK